jgi:hypothetical protein
MQQETGNTASSCTAFSACLHKQVVQPKKPTSTYPLICLGLSEGIRELNLSSSRGICYIELTNRVYVDGLGFKSIGWSNASRRQRRTRDGDGAAA